MNFVCFWASAGAGALPRKRESGFTLVELMIALLIFGMLAAAGVGLLRFSIDAQAATKTRLDLLASGRRVESLIAADAAQAVPRLTRNEAGDMVPAFEGNAAGFTLVRAGLDPLADVGRSSLQKVRYQLEGRAFTRRTWPMLDGAVPATPSVLVADVAAVQLRYRSREGWRELWDPIKPDLLPRAIEMVVRPVRGPELRYMFLVGAGA